METQQLNRVELVGCVGSIRISLVGGLMMVSMAVATSIVYETRSGEKVIETNWTQVTCFQKDSGLDLSAISKGDAVHVIGRIRNNRYTGSDGVEKSMTEVIASFIEKVDGRPLVQEM